MTCPPSAFQTSDHLIRLDPGQSVTTAWGHEWSHHDVLWRPGRQRQTGGRPQAGSPAR